MPDPLVAVPLAEATDRQLLQLVARTTLILEVAVTELTQAVDDLRVSVDAVRQRVEGSLGPLEQALADAQTQAQALTDTLAQERSDDATEDAAFNETIAQQAADLAARVGEASAAASDIRGQVDALNAIAQPPAEPA